MITEIERRKAEDYERYRQFSMEQLMEDEATFAGENLRTHNVNAIHYKRDEVGSHYVKTVSADGKDQRLYLKSMAEDSVKKYAEFASINPLVDWQRRRVEIEKNHVEFAESMPADSCYIVISDCPEAELETAGQNMFGYILERKLGFLQLFHVDSNRDLTIYSHSFEGNDRDGIAAIYRRYEQPFDSNDSDNWALSQPIYLERTQGIDPQIEIQLMLASYDKELYQKDGLERYSGIERQRLKQEGNAFVRAQDDLLKAHCEKVLFVGPHSDTASRYRYDFAVAIRKRFDGETVQGDFSSLGGELASAGDDGRASGETVDACGNSLSFTASNIDNQGFNFLKKVEQKTTIGSCQACLRDNVTVGGCGVCMGCESDNTLYGTDLMKRRQAALAAQVAKSKAHMAAPIFATTKEINSRPKQNDMIKMKYGEHAVAKSVIVLGGSKTVVIDQRTKQEIG